MTDLTDASRQLVQFLADRTGYRSTSFLEDRVRLEIQRVADDIAREMVDATPALFARVAELTRQTIDAALRDDVRLSAVVTRAVAEALNKHRVGADEDD